MCLATNDIRLSDVAPLIPASAARLAGPAAASARTCVSANANYVDAGNRLLSRYSVLKTPFIPASFLL